MAIKGVLHRLAFVDLNTGTVTYEDPGDELYEKYLGGYGLGAYMLYTRQKPGLDALAPEAMLGLLTGPLTGTDAITGNRFIAVGKSPKTGTWGDANCGGYFGPALKEAGLDGVFFTGAAKDPVYVLVQNGEVTVECAADYWGLDSVETEAKFQAAYGKRARVACIGPSGERVSALAAIINDGGRAAGRSGLGMVMGSKKLKAVVAVPSSPVEVADADALKAVRQRVLGEYYKAGNPAYELFSSYGTCGITAGSVQKGDAPIKNWSGTVHDFPTAEKISDDAVIATQTRKYGCWRCPLACGGHVKVAEGAYEVEGHKPEYETLAAFGAMCLNDNLASITVCNDICNRMGMDTISAGCTVAFAIECYERGIITKEDTGGLELTWGNHEAIVKVTEQMGDGTGFGGIVLGDGIKTAVGRIGPEAEVAAMHCAGEELPMHDPRCSPGIGASFVIDATPGRHTQYGSWLDEAAFLPPDLGQPLHADKYVYNGKGENGAYVSRWGHVVNASGLCMFGCTVTPAPAVPEFLTHAMGVEYTMDKVQEVGGRIGALRMAFNIREGVRNPLDFKLPRRVLGDPPLEQGDTAGVTVDNIVEIKDYCAAMGWDPETGVPSRETLEGYDLGFVAKDLHG
ncbi:MAG: aldehyde ferredoxin oxidoreductase family protein [Armatimonadetes bacterium]|nr:aldehyde ferredoxin oxidoreductase family protein [Armatimonadota bacterium]